MASRTKRPDEVNALETFFGYRDAVREADDGWWSSCPIPRADRDGPVYCGATMFVARLHDGTGRYTPTCGHSADEVAAAVAGVLTANGNGATPAPPSEPIDGAELLDSIGGFIERFQVLPSAEVRDLLALWVLHTHAFEAAWATPYLRVTSAAPESGKTQLLEILATLTRNGWHAVNPSVAVLYRKIDKQTPTLLLDEMDDYPVEERRDALSVLNAGYKRGATIDRCRENGDLESFSAYCPKAYAGLDKHQLVDTLLSRSITIRLERRLPIEQVDMWIGQLTEHQADPIRERCAAWAAQNVSDLAVLEPTLPAGIINRAAEVWWALLAIAEQVRGDWPARATAAARTLSTGGDDRDGRTEQILLLADLATAFAERDVMFTAELLTMLNGLDESPWGARRRGDGLDARGLSRLLRPFGIRPRTVRVGEKTAKGYHLDQFEGAFARHLPEPSQGPQASQPAPVLEPDVTDVTGVTDFQGGVS